MSFPLTAKSFDFPQEEKQQTPQSQASNGNNYWFFKFSQNMKITQILAGLFFFYSGRQKPKTVGPKSELKNDMKMKRKKYVEFCLFVSPALWYINQPESFED